MKRLTWLAVFALAVSACGDGTGPEGVPESELRFVKQDPLAPPLYAVQDTFWAKVGDGRDLRLYYQGATPTELGDELLRFEVPGDGLYRKPDGTAFVAGEEILITITVVDPQRFIFKFEPTGLRFNPDNPARLRIRYGNADHDFDEDGVEDSEDAEIESRLLDVWRQPAPGALWLKLGAVKFEEADELDTKIFTFSNYSVAW